MKASYKFSVSEFLTLMRGLSAMLAESRKVTRVNDGKEDVVCVSKDYVDQKFDQVYKAIKAAYEDVKGEKDHVIKR